MAHDDELEARMAQIRQMSGQVAFDAGFADRVMARLDRPQRLADGMERAFIRLVPLAAAAALLLGAMNLINTRASGDPFIDRVLGLSSVSLSAAYTLDGALAGMTEVGR